MTNLSADGLHDGDHSWYQTQFDAFTRATGVKVQPSEMARRTIVERLSKERNNTAGRRARDMPPFINARRRKNCCGTLPTGRPRES